MSWKRLAGRLLLLGQCPIGCFGRVPFYQLLSWLWLPPLLLWPGLPLRSNLGFLLWCSLSPLCRCKTWYQGYNSPTNLFSAMEKLVHGLDLLFRSPTQIFQNIQVNLKNPARNTLNPYNCPGQVEATLFNASVALCLIVNGEFLVTYVIYQHLVCYST